MRYIGLLKGLSHEIFRPVFGPVWMRLGLNVNRLWFFKIFIKILLFLAAILTFGVLHTNLLGDSMNLREGLTAVLKTRLCC